ncbi:MAG: hypothetical protein QOC60_831 [Frankiaceae bacterium]|nr:hypothetical protein [Frankiaceae bacterium]
MFEEPPRSADGRAPELPRTAPAPALVRPVAGTAFPLFGRPAKTGRPSMQSDPIVPEHVSLVMGRFGTDVLDVLTATQVLDVLEVAAPGPQMVVLAHELQSRVLNDLDLSRLLSVWQRLESWHVSRMDIAIVAVAGDEPASSVDYGREEAALAMRMSPRGGMGRVAEARLRTGRVPEVGYALASGTLTRGQAFDLTVAVGRFDDALARAVCDRVLPVALKKSRSEFKTAIEKAVIAVDAAGAATRHIKAKRERSVTLVRHPDNMAEIVAYTTAVEAESVYDALHATAVRDRMPGQRIDNARADVLVAWANRAHAEPDLPRAHGRRPELRLTMTMESFLGFTDDPAVLDGYGPIHPMLARDLAGGATLRRLITDARTGGLLDFGRQTYTAPQSLADHITTRDGTCRLVGCAQPAKRCDLDHRKEWQDGGTTDPDNMSALCERHHVMRHKGNWRLEQDDGQLMWITPAGREYLVHQEPVDPSFI